MERIAIEGIDGSGKTATCHALADYFETRDMSPAIFSPYRVANETLGMDIYELWFDKTTCIDAIKLMKQTVDSCEQQAADQAAQVIIYDRHWMTALTASEHNQELAATWVTHGPKFVPTAVLKVPIETALLRRAEEYQHGNLPAYMEPSVLEHDAELYTHLAAKHAEHILGIYRSDNDVAPHAIAKNIYWDMNVRR